MSELIPITVAHGDGIGPEIMEATLKILSAAGARIAPERIEIGEKVYLSGNTSGIPDEAWESIRRTKLLLKSPITTPYGGGYKSINVTMRNALGLYANVRPCIAYHPFVRTLFPTLNVVIVRENEEDLYAGIEHRQTAQVVQTLKLISRPGCEKIVRYAFEYATNNGRKKVSCFLKDNIMKMSDGLFREVFDEVKAEYPEIETDTYIIDIGAAKLATAPERFDVIVVENLYGDIISDIAAEMTGSVGLAGSANIGNQCSMFEAIHGSAPDIAGKGIANPSGLLLGAVMMLVHIGQNDVASKIHNAWLRTIEEGNHTVDIFQAGLSKAKLTTHQFTNAVIENLGEVPLKLKAVNYAKANTRKSNIQDSDLHYTHPVKDLVGIDVFFDWSAGTAQEFGDMVNALSTDQLVLQMVSNRGAKVWPDGFKETFCTDHWRARFKCPDNVKSLPYSAVLDLMHRLVDAGLYVIKTENLYFFDGEPGYTRAQGQ